MDVLKSRSTILATTLTAALTCFGLAVSNARGVDYYVNIISGTPGIDGNSWDEPFVSLQTALDRALTAGADRIFVAAGLYVPSSPSGEAATFNVPTRTQLYGGFPDGLTGQVMGNDFTDRNVKVNTTILSGDLGSENAHHVVTAYSTFGASIEARIDGFTIQDGKADGSGESASGGGLIADSIRLLNCTFLANSAGTTTDNGSGGAVWLDGQTGGSPAPVGHFIWNCTFLGNSVIGQGGALSINDDDASIVNCLFAGNSAMENDPTGNGRGGAIFLEDGAGFLIEIINCTIADNQAATGNAAVEAGLAFTISVNNSILAGNSPNDIFEQMQFVGASSLVAGDPKFRGGGDYRLQFDSPARNSIGQNSQTPDDIWDVDDDSAQVGLEPAPTSISLDASGPDHPEHPAQSMSAPSSGSAKATSTTMELLISKTCSRSSSSGAPCWRPTPTSTTMVSSASRTSFSSCCGGEPARGRPERSRPHSTRALPAPASHRHSGRRSSAS